MHIISFVTQKGGSGKTTLAVNCAVVAVQQGQKVFVLDMDDQATAERWFDWRSDELPQVKRVSPAQLDAALSGLRSKGFDVVLIDTPGRDDVGVAAAMRASDFCLIPCRPSPADIQATPPTIETVKRLGKKCAFVLTQTPVRSYRLREAEKGLGVYGVVCSVHIVLRNAYQDAQGAGLGVTELEPNGKAADEMRRLWAWITKKVERVEHGNE